MRSLVFIVLSLAIVSCTSKWQPGDSINNGHDFLTSAGISEEIESFFMEDLDETGRFQRKFARLCGLINSKVGLSDVNYVSLAYDLLDWNKESRERRYKWASAVLLKKEEKEEKENK